MMREIPSKKVLCLLKSIQPNFKTPGKKVIFNLNTIKNGLDLLKKSLSRIRIKIQINKNITKLSVSSTDFRIGSAMSMLKSKKAMLKKVKHDFMRTKNLYSHYALSKVKYQDAQTDLVAGEFTKVAQRVGIRIKLTDSDLSGLKVGLGYEAEIKRSK